MSERPRLGAGWRGTLIVATFLVLLLAVASFAIASAAPVEQNAAQGQQLFEQKCAGCHSIGAGKKVGPDLKGISQQRPHDWLVNFIATPDKVIANGDPTAQQLVKEYGMPMPNLGLTANQAADVLAYIDGQSGAAPSGQATPVPAPAAPQGNAAAGKQYYEGSLRFANGGPPCIGCHNAAGSGALGGGSWGLDLSQVPTTQTVASVRSILQAPPFPGMTEAFAERPLSQTEIADVAAYLVQVHGQPSPDSNGLLFLAGGIALLIAVFAAAQLAWRKRLTGARKPLVGV
ncbi:MAG: c-type cytochrome [Chloroflexota bacterium]